MNAIIIITLFLSTPILVIGHLAIIEERRKSRVRKSLEIAILQVARENRLIILKKEYFLNRAIGVDSENRKLVFAIRSEDGIKGYCVDIDNLSYSRLTTIFDKSSKQIKKLFLELKSNGNNEIMKLTFFDRNKDNFSAIPLLIRKAEYWKDRINETRRAIVHNQSLEFVL